MQTHKQISLKLHKEQIKKSSLVCATYLYLISDPFQNMEARIDQARLSHRNIGLRHNI